jgi:mRNA interferase RelE/StbE
MATPEYRLTYKDKALKDIRKMDPVMKKRLAETLRRFIQDPLAHSVKLKKSGLAGQYRFRVGNYRALYDIEGNEVVVLRVMHRREVYER